MMVIVFCCGQPCAAALVQNTAAVATAASQYPILLYLIFPNDMSPPTPASVGPGEYQDYQIPARRIDALAR
jgi:hypothetical protein